jgi:hypothetical protein
MISAPARVGTGVASGFGLLFGCAFTAKHDIAKTNIANINL